MPTQYAITSGDRTLMAGEKSSIQPMYKALAGMAHGYSGYIEYLQGLKDFAMLMPVLDEVCGMIYLKAPISLIADGRVVSTHTPVEPYYSHKLDSLFLYGIGSLYQARLSERSQYTGSVEEIALNDILFTELSGTHLREFLLESLSQAS